MSSRVSAPLRPHPHSGGARGKHPAHRPRRRTPWRRAARDWRGRTAVVVAASVSTTPWLVRHATAAAESPTRGVAPAVPVLTVARTLDAGVEPELTERIDVQTVPALGMRRQERTHA